MTQEEKSELESIRYTEAKLKKQAAAYIVENGLNSFLSLPPWENFTLNARKVKRKMYLEVEEAEDKMYNND